MKLFTGDIETLPEKKIDEKNGKAFDENVLYLPLDGPGQKLAQADMLYSRDYYDAVAAGIKDKPKKPSGGQSKAVTPTENK